MPTFHTKKNKYGVSKKEDRTVDGIVFASKREAVRYCELKLIARCGQIQDLELQPEWKIVINGQLVCKYVADFRYVENGETVVEDAKGMATPVYKLKKKLMRAVHGITIKEV